MNISSAYTSYNTIKSIHQLQYNYSSLYSLNIVGELVLVFTVLLCLLLRIIKPFKYIHVTPNTIPRTVHHHRTVRRNHRTDPVTVAEFVYALQERYTEHSHRR